MPAAHARCSSSVMRVRATPRRRNRRHQAFALAWESGGGLTDAPSATASKRSPVTKWGSSSHNGVASDSTTSFSIAGVVDSGGVGGVTMAATMCSTDFVSLSAQMAWRTPRSGMWCSEHRPPTRSANRCYSHAARRASPSAACRRLRRLTWNTTIDIVVSFWSSRPNPGRAPLEDR